MVVHPFRATGPLMSLPERGSRPIKLHASSCMRMMSKSVGAKLLSSWVVTCFLCWTLSWAILIGWVVIGGHSVMLKGGGLGWSAWGLWRCGSSVTRICWGRCEGGIWGFQAVEAFGFGFLVLTLIQGLLEWVAQRSSSRAVPYLRSLAGHLLASAGWSCSTLGLPRQLMQRMSWGAEVGVVRCHGVACLGRADAFWAAYRVGLVMFFFLVGFAAEVAAAVF